MATNQLIVSDDMSLAATGLSEELISRCLALQMPLRHIFIVSQLTVFYGCPSDKIVSYVENGIGLPQVAECLRLMVEVDGLLDTKLETVHEFVELINFYSTNEVDDGESQKIIYRGRALTAEQLEDALIQELTGEGSKTAPANTQPIIEHPHDKIIEALLDGTLDNAHIEDEEDDDQDEESDDHVEALLNKIKEEMDGDILLAYHLCVNDPNKFRQFICGNVDAHSLRYSANVADISSHYDELLHTEI